MPRMGDSVAATFNNGSPTGTANAAANLNSDMDGTTKSDNTFEINSNKVLTVGRMSSATYLDNSTDENTMVAILPMLREGMVRSHARAVEIMCLGGTGANGTATASTANNAVASSGGFGIMAAAPSTPTAVSGSSDTLDPDDIIVGRGLMKKYGMDPAKLILVVGFIAYNDLLKSADFADITQVGSELAQKVTGTVGTLFGTPVIVSDLVGLNPANNVGTNICACLYNVDNFIRPRMRGVSIETEYQVANQRNALVASQTLGFDQLFDGSTALGVPAVNFRYT